MISRTNKGAVLISFFLILSLLFTCLAAIETAFQTRQIYSQLQSSYAERNYLGVEWGRLLLEKASIASDARLDRIAQDHFLMKIPISKDIVLIERSQ